MSVEALGSSTLRCRTALYCRGGLRLVKLKSGQAKPFFCSLAHSDGAADVRLRLVAHRVLWRVGAVQTHACLGWEGSALWWAGVPFLGHFYLPCIPKLGISCAARALPSWARLPHAGRHCTPCHARRAAACRRAARRRQRATPPRWSAQRPTRPRAGACRSASGPSLTMTGCGRGRRRCWRATSW